jgi:4-hydroxy-tetrahydrodipicolinate reductase
MPNKPIDCPIESIREGEVPGIHEVRWESEADILTLRHEAKSRQGFALGAVLAAEYLAGKRGWHTMNEVMNIQ